MARAGSSAAEIFADLSERFQDIASGQLEAIANQERERDDRLNSLAALPFGQFANLLRESNCPQSATGFQINMTVRGVDPQTGNPTSRNETVRVEGARSVSALLTTAVRQIVESAELSGSPISGPQRVTAEYVAQNVTISYIDCY